MDIIEQKIEEIKEKYAKFLDVRDNVNIAEDLHDLVQVVQMSKSENAKIIVPFSENDLDELRNGEEFDWTFPTQVEGEYVDIQLRLEDEEGE